MSIYLYTKQCKHCGLKYFGKTINSNVEKYLGSGTYWKRHIHLHGVEHVITNDVWKFDTQIEATQFALNFSQENNIVESLEWANLIAEDGIDGNSSAIITEELRTKFSAANTGENNPQYGTKWITNGSTNMKIQFGDHVPDGWRFGRYFKDDARETFVSRSKKDKNNPRYNHTLYRFENASTKEQITSTFREFYTKYKLNSKGVRKLIRKQIEEFKGWTIVD